MISNPTVVFGKHHADKCRDDVLGTHRGGGMSCHLGLAVTEVEALVKARQERYEARASKPKQARSLELLTCSPALNPEHGWAMETYTVQVLP